MPDAVAHPVDTAKDLGAEAAEGRSERTPWIILGGLTATIAVVVGIVVAVVIVLYLMLGGK